MTYEELMDDFVKYVVTHADLLHGMAVTPTLLGEALDEYGMRFDRWDPELYSACETALLQWADPAAYGCLLFLGQGLGSSPGLNDRNRREILSCMRMRELMYAFPDCFR